MLGIYCATSAQLPLLSLYLLQKNFQLRKKSWNVKLLRNIKCKRTHPLVWFYEVGTLSLLRDHQKHTLLSLLCIYYLLDNEDFLHYPCTRLLIEKNSLGPINQFEYRNIISFFTPIVSDRVKCCDNGKQAAIAIDACTNSNFWRFFPDNLSEII